jgi:hypothetical protein
MSNIHPPTIPKTPRGSYLASLQPDKLAARRKAPPPPPLSFSPARHRDLPAGGPAVLRLEVAASGEGIQAVGMGKVRLIVACVRA